MTDRDIKHETLEMYLNCEGVNQEEIKEILEEYKNEERFECNGEELLILDEEEADALAFSIIEESLWYFNANFIASHINGVEDRDALIESIEKIQEQCEDANEAVKAMIDDLGEFVGEAIAVDGRGHFLSSYDGEENEFYIKRSSKEGETPKYDMSYGVFIYRN